MKSKKKMQVDLKAVKKPYIYEDEKYQRWQRRLIIFGLPLLIISLFIHFLFNQHLPLKPLMWGAAMGSSAYIVMVSMVRQGTKRFWIIFGYLFCAGSVPLFWDIPVVVEHIPYFSRYSAELTTLSFLFFPISYFGYGFYYQFREHRRCAIKKNAADIPTKRIQLRQALGKLKPGSFKPKQTKAGRRIAPNIYRKKDTSSKLRFKFVLWGLPLLGLLLFVGNFWVKGNFAIYSLSLLSMGLFCILIACLPPNCMTFWILFFLGLIIGLPNSLPYARSFTMPAWQQSFYIGVFFTISVIIFYWKLAQEYAVED